ncbi:MAG: amidohydrolase family protein [Cytophagales bacterium]|nr:amidohydrolase family protein [Cytophaga sp.]
MKTFDFNIHLPYLKHEDVNEVIHQDMTLDLAGIARGFDIHKREISKCDGANFLLFNTDLFKEDVSPFFKSVQTIIKQVKYTALINFRNKDVTAYIDNIHRAGVHAIMFNSYLQQITNEDFTTVIKVCQYAASKGIIICVDGSYGTSKMYNYNNIQLVCAVADHVTNTPIVIVHSGGYRLIEAMLLAADKQNVWLDTSFSLPYYINSSIEGDFAYVMRKMDMNRVVYGSDHPYINLMDAVSIHMDFFQKHQFTDSEIEKVMWQNAQQLFNEF